MKNKYLPYTLHFTSFILESLELEDIQHIILFGSVARNEATKESDIDLFIDITRNEKHYKKKIKLLEEDFYKSKFYLTYWKPKGFENNFNLIIGKLEQWKELKDSIISSGITLYSKYKDLPNTFTHHTLLSFENIRPESKRVSLNKKLYGYNFKEKHYLGLLEKYNGAKLNKGTILIPLEHKNLFLNLFRTLKITVKIKNIIEY
ncbi:MAG: nucleotidyltransferase domain-containing protein [Candidatus Nanoarchaeia archaeon]